MMSKLKCRKHNTRVMVMSNGHVVHRQGGEVCFTDFVVISTKRYTPREVAAGVHKELDGIPE